jgi:hypothetical protein
MATPPEDFEASLRRLGLHPRPRPKRDLLPGIEARIARPQVVVLTPRQWRTLVAAAVLLLLVNAVALAYYATAAAAPEPTYALLSNYLLYSS